MKTIALPNSLYQIRYDETHPDHYQVWHNNKDITAMTASGHTSFLIRDMITYLISNDVSSNNSGTIEYLQKLKKQRRIMELPVPFGTGVWTYQDGHLSCVPFALQHIPQLNKTVWTKYETAVEHGEPTYEN